jgi:hypothetical protein
MLLKRQLRRELGAVVCLDSLGDNGIGIRRPDPNGSSASKTREEIAQLAGLLHQEVDIGDAGGDAAAGARLCLATAV